MGMGRHGVVYLHMHARGTGDGILALGPLVPPQSQSWYGLSQSD